MTNGEGLGVAAAAWSDGVGDAIEVLQQLWRSRAFVKESVMRNQVFQFDFHQMITLRTSLWFIFSRQDWNFHWRRGPFSFLGKPLLTVPSSFFILFILFASGPLGKRHPVSLKRRIRKMCFFAAFLCVAQLRSPFQFFMQENKGEGSQKPSHPFRKGEEPFCMWSSTDLGLSNR